MLVAIHVHKLLVGAVATAILNNIFDVGYAYSWCISV